MKHYSILLLVIILLSQVSLTGKAFNSDGPSSIQESIHRHIDQLEKSKTIILGGQKIIGNPVITGMYKIADYKPLWDMTKNRNDLISILDDSYFEGLNPKDYHIDLIKQHDEEIEKRCQGKCRKFCDSRYCYDRCFTNICLSHDSG